MAKKQSKRKQRQDKHKTSFKEVNLRPLNEAQAEFLEMLEDEDCLIVVGPAGTGKTYLACSYAANQIAKGRVDKIVLTRPLRGVGDSAGFIPGSLEQKMAPWCRPLVDVFKQQMSVTKYEAAVASQKIEISPIEHIRGLTYDNTILIIDEAQNTTPTEMKAILTRIGQNTQVIISGDVEQTDLNVYNGLSACVEAFEEGHVPLAALFEFTYDDIVRSELCKIWAQAFNKLCKK
jgi:phosphate starvation-inducible PhoH-like protein